MSTKRKQKQKEDNDSQNLFDSFKKIFKGNSKSNKLNRVVSHKPQLTLHKGGSFQRRPRSQSEPDLLSDSLVLDSGEIRLEPFPGSSNLLRINEMPLKSRSFDNFNQELADNCPTKAAKRLGLGQDEPKFKMKDKKEQLAVSGGFKTKKSGTSTRASLRFSMKSKDREAKEKTVEMEVVDIPTNMPQKAAKMLGIQAVEVSSKAAKTLGISSHSDEQTNTQTTEDFLRKIGAFASEKGKSSQKLLQVNAASPVIMSKSSKSDQKPVADISTNVLLRRLVQLTPTEQGQRPRSTKLLLKTQSEDRLAISRKRRIAARSENTDASSESRQNSSDHESEKHGKEKSPCLQRPEQRSLPPNPVSLSANQGRKSSVTLTIADHRTEQLTFESNKELNKDQREPYSHRTASKSSEQLPILKALQLNHKKLLKKCESDSRINIPIKRHAASPTNNRKTIMMIPSRKLSDGEETPAIMLTPAPTVVKLFKKTSLGDVLRGRNKGTSPVAAT